MSRAPLEISVQLVGSGTQPLKLVAPAVWTVVFAILSSLIILAANVSTVAAATALDLELVTSTGGTGGSTSTGNITGVADPLLTSASHADREHYAIVVGINRYRLANPLDHAVADAQRVAGVLESQGYTVQRLLDAEAAQSSDVIERIEAVAALMQDTEPALRGNFVLTFSGHGFSQGSDNYLALSRTDPARLQDTALSLSTLKQVMAASGIERQVLFIDACRNDPGKGLADAQARFVPDDDAQGVAILYSTSPGSLAWEDPALGHGVFSHYLAQGLAGAAADQHGVVSFDSLHRYVRSEVKSHVFAKYDRQQVPYIAGERSGRFVLGGSPLEPLVKPGARNGAADTVAVARNADKRSASSGRFWATVGTVLGVIALGVLASNRGGSDGSDDDASTDGVTLVVPVP